MRWYEHITESATFKRLDNPATTIGAIITAIVAVAFSALAFAQNPSVSHDCTTNPLRGVYNPKRLKVLKTCQTITGTVQHTAKERDGDLHIQLKTDPKWINPVNIARQHGDLVVEYMPGDPYPRPAGGDRLQLNCTWVADQQHGGWNECHPVWSVQPQGGLAARVEP